MNDPKAAEAAQVAAHVAGFLERGQSESPLHDASRNLNIGDDASLEIALAGLDAPSRSMVVRWLIGPQHHAITVRLTESLGLMEIRLQERGYTISTELGQAHEFSQAEPFANALHESLKNIGLAGAEVNSLKLGLAVPPPLRNIGIAVLPELATVLQQPGLLGALTAQPAVLALAIPDGRPLTSADLGALRVIASRCVALWPIVVGESTAVTDATFSALSSLDIPILGVSVLSPAGGAFLPSFVTGGTGNPIRAGVSSIARARNFRCVLDMLGHRLDTDMSQLRARSQREARLERHSDADHREQAIRSAFDSLKSGVNEDFSQLMLAVREQNRRAVSRMGHFGKALREIAQTVHGRDLNRTPGQKLVRLTLKEEVRAELRTRFGKAVRHTVDECCVLIRDSLDMARLRIEEGLVRAGAEMRSIPMAAPDSLEIWEVLHQAVEIEVTYRGEIQKRGFLQRLGQGRQIVFSGLMILSLVGSFIGFNFRRAAAVGLVLLVVFAIAVAYTYKSWAREDNEAIDKEIEKLNDIVGMELERLGSEAIREMDARFQAILDATRRSIHVRLDTISRQTLASHIKTSETARANARAKIKLLEGREKEFAVCGQQLAKARQLVEGMADAGAARLKEALKPVVHATVKG